MSPKQQLLEALQDLPDDVTIEQAMERLYFLAKLERGLAQADAGEMIQHDEVRRRLLK